LNLDIQKKVLLKAPQLPCCGGPIEPPFLDEITHAASPYHEGCLFDDMEIALDVITRLEMHRDAMRNCQEDGDFEGRMPKRIKCVEAALDKAYDRLGHFGVIDEAD